MLSKQSNSPVLQVLFAAAVAGCFFLVNPFLLLVAVLGGPCWLLLYSLALGLACLTAIAIFKLGWPFAIALSLMTTLGTCLFGMFAVHIDSSDFVFVGQID